MHNERMTWRSEGNGMNENSGLNQSEYNGTHIQVENPATNEIIKSVPVCGMDDVERMVSSANDAFLSWRRTPESVRRATLVKLAEILEGHRDDLAITLVREVGKPLAEARHEVMSAARVFRTFSEMRFSDEIVKEDEGSLIYVTRSPLGVAGLILPWNYPLAVLSWKLAPALLTGNAVIVKPSPFTPLNTLHFLALATDVLPNDIVQVATGDDRTGEFVVRSDGVRKIAFTGHMGTGRRILAESAASAGNIKRVSLELGGNDPAIVMKDFDLKHTPSVFWSSFRNAGQICIAVKRVYVHESIYSNFVERYVRIAESVKVGNGLDEGTQMGPISNPEQLAVVEDLVRDARESGGGILTGGERMPGPGYFYPPTVIADVDEGTRIVNEEQFGPVAPILSYSDINEAIQRANSLEFGLGGSVWTSDWKKGQQIAEELECGTAWVNTHMVVDPLAPFGGVKGSGIGRELGRSGIDEYVDLRTIHVKK